MVHTSSAGLYSVAAIIASTTLTSVCGHAVDLGNIQYVAIAGALFATFADMYKRRKSGVVVTP